MQDWVPSRFWFYARSRHLYLECWHPPNHRNLRRGKPQIAPNQGFLLPLFPGVLGGEASQGMPITYKYIYIYTHIYKHIYIYMYLNICYTVNIHIYIIHIAHRRATLARTQLAHLLKLCSVPRNREIDGSWFGGWPCGLVDPALKKMVPRKTASFWKLWIL